MDVPTFGGAKRLARYIEPEFCQENRRAKPPAFMEDQEAKRNGLSVNSLEILTVNQIAAFYSDQFGDERPVAISTPRVDDYNRAAEEAGIAIRGYHSCEPHWTNAGAQGDEASYEHDPRAMNKSHCLARFTRLFDEISEFRFAVRMAHKPTFRMY